MPEAKLDTLKKRFKLAFESEQKQKEREREDLKFQVPEFQWDEQARRERMGSVVAGIPTPPRPTLSVSKIDQPIQLVLNQMRAARLGVHIHPLSPEADDEVAEIIQGIYRQIERDSQANQARAWGFERAVKAGRGYYRINTKYDESGGHPFDQVITIDRILRQEAVYFDPAATKADFSDARFCFIVDWMPVEDFREAYPDAEMAAADFDLGPMVVEEPLWVRGDGERGAVQVAECFERVIEKRKIVLGDDGQVYDEDDLPTRVKAIMTREVEEPSVKWYKLTAGEILEEQDWNGRYIPVIPCLGRELVPFDEERRWQGIIGPAKDAQRSYNYNLSNAVETVALEPRAPWVMAEGQDEGHEDEWLQANIRNIPVLHYKPTTLKDGTPAPPPQRTPVDVGRIAPSMALLQQANNDVQGATNTYDPSLGRDNPREKSGKAIRALQSQSEAGNSDYLHNLADISMMCEARVVMYLIPAIWDRPGRVARVVDNEDRSETVILNAAYIVDPRTKRPVRIPVVMGEDGRPAMPLRPAPGVQVPPSAPPRPGQPPSPAEIRYHDLRAGVYSVSVNIGKSFQTLREQGADELTEILQAAPNWLPILGATVLRFRDFPGSDEVADILQKVRNQEFPFLNEDESAGNAEAKAQALEQENLQLKQALQEASKAIETDQVKAQAQLQGKQLDAETKLAVAKMDNQTRLIIEQMSQRAELMQQQLEHKLEAMLEVLKQTSARREGVEDRAADAAKTAMQGEIEMAKADLNFKQSMEMGLGEEEQV